MSPCSARGCEEEAIALLTIVLVWETGEQESALTDICVCEPHSFLKASDLLNDEGWAAMMRRYVDYDIGMPKRSLTTIGRLRLDDSTA